MRVMFDPAAVLAAEARGMSTSYWAQVKPDAPAVFDRFGQRTFGEVNARANRIVRLLRGLGVRAGEHVAFVSSNRAEVMEILAATLRGGYRLIPVNWRFTEAEVAHVLEDSDAVAVFAETRFPAALEASRKAARLKARIAIGGEAEGHLALEAAISGLDGSDIADPQLGSTMFYTSGTTGRPKGVFREGLNLLAPGALESHDPATDVQLCAGPCYHGAGLTVDTRTAMSVGVPVAYIEKWDSLEVLRTIEARRVTHAHMVPIMFQRLLAVPKDVREQFDLSSLKRILHGAAPCPPEVKRAMIDWLGPILTEYYAGTEGGAGFFIDSHEWLERPGSVGRRPTGAGVKILDDEGREPPPGVPGRIYMQRAQASPFSYYKDPEKTAGSYLGDYFTLGDVGYFDEAGYLFLTGRTAECIISGGVNIYPAEIDNALVTHPAVADVATVGAPNAEWGEEVKAVVQLNPGWTEGPELTQALIAHARLTLAGYKAPKSIDYVDELPRNEAGKAERARIRARYWQGRTKQI
ncbi:MAG: acyl-CoA synthetase (AMP-forming)/AMP-acid ligase [Phenylobacterium sp.]|nr:acyl-CoA synthetase (AMP-forming)/AMP-acid ligase [Phenylobacterium sp.]